MQIPLQPFSFLSFFKCMQMPPFDHSLHGITAETILGLAQQVSASCSFHFSTHLLPDKGLCNLAYCQSCHPLQFLQTIQCSNHRLHAFLACFPHRGVYDNIILVHSVQHGYEGTDITLALSLGWAGQWNDELANITIFHLMTSDDIVCSDQCQPLSRV